MHERGQTKPFEGVPENDRDTLISQSERIKCSLSDSLGDGILAMEYDGAEAILEMTSEDLETVSSARARNDPVALV
jgi:hypothetical protein